MGKIENKTHKIANTMLSSKIWLKISTNDVKIMNGHGDDFVQILFILSLLFRMLKKFNCNDQYNLIFQS